MNAQEKKYAIWTIAETDPHYQKLLRRMSILETRYEFVMQTLDNRTKEVICDFVAMCEEMSESMLEIACQRMDFIENHAPEQDSEGR